MYLPNYLLYLCVYTNNSIVWDFIYYYQQIRKNSSPTIRKRWARHFCSTTRAFLNFSFVLTNSSLPFVLSTKKFQNVFLSNTPSLFSSVLVVAYVSHTYNAIKTLYNVIFDLLESNFDLNNVDNPNSEWAFWASVCYYQSFLYFLMIPWVFGHPLSKVFESHFQGNSFKWKIFLILL